MQDAIEYLLGTASFVPHGYCLLWRPDLVWVHAVSDLLIALAYFSIPLALINFVRRRRDLAIQADLLDVRGIHHRFGLW
jgi:hypothetical protein